MRYCFIIPTLFFSIYFIYGAEDTCIKSTKGTDFWFGFMESRNYLNNHAVEINLTPFKLSIFNRWGEMVFESNSNQIPWEGKLKSGKNAPGGNYVWTLEYTDIQGVRHKERGQVLLIR